jgi:ABC-type Zn2+ transport system substrate-binding protein/surface adhesin
VPQHIRAILLTLISGKSTAPYRLHVFWQPNITTGSIKMTDNIENSVIEPLKALRGEIKEFRSQHDADTADIKHRLTSLERGMSAVKRDASDYYEGQVDQQITIDRLSERLDRIERRLEQT